MRIATIGVYGFDLERFLATLHDADVELVVDVRQRRGVRGSEYAWANAKRLQAGLADAGIDYEHRKELAPTTELRQLQYREDERRGEGKRSRSELAPEYRDRYLREILDPIELARLAEHFADAGPAALLCVERDAQACHRSLIAGRLAADHGFEVRNLGP